MAICVYHYTIIILLPEPLLLQLTYCLCFCSRPRSFFSAEQLPHSFGELLNILLNNLHLLRAAKFLECEYSYPHSSNLAANSHFELDINSQGVRAIHTCWSFNHHLGKCTHYIQFNDRLSSVLYSVYGRFG